MILFTWFFLFGIVGSQKLELTLNPERMNRGKAKLEKFEKKKSHSDCWYKALSKLDVICRDINDMQQSLLALQFANCHLEKSGLETYDCDENNFKSCSQKMGSNIIAFQTYTEFFTHVADICFYLQSSLWQQKTESTITKLTETSEESLQVLSKSIQKQQEVLTSQEQSLQNQKDILNNEKLLKETLLHSAQSAKDVFQEVREHAQQQKTMFAETFDHIFQSVEKLTCLQSMLLGEFIGLQSVGFYVVSVIICYLFTSTPRTSSARLPLFFGLTLMIVSERVFVEWRVASVTDEFSSEQVHDQIWLIRKIFLSIAFIALGVCIMRYKDFNRINFSLLQEIQIQVLELRKFQETQNIEQISSQSINEIDETMKPVHNIKDITNKLEMSLQAFISSTPQKLLKHSDPFTMNPPRKYHHLNQTLERNEFSDCDEIEMRYKKPKVRKSTSKLDATLKKDTSLNESRYNLRTRRSSSSFNVSHVKKSLKKKSVGEFSSDEDS